jgi:hypothetical protein
MKPKIELTFEAFKRWEIVKLVEAKDGEYSFDNLDGDNCMDWLKQKLFGDEK